MKHFILGFVTAALLGVAWELKRAARLRYLTQAEELRLRFSDLRHRLVMYAGEGQLGREEKKGFAFLYHATSLLLRYPMFYRQFSDSTCVAMVNRFDLPPPTVKKKDFSVQTKEFLREYVKGADEVVQRFSNPVYVFLAAMQGKRVLEMMSELGTFKSEMVREKQALEEWRRAGARALQESVA